jgi:hypothetical protein
MGEAEMVRTGSGGKQLHLVLFEGTRQQLFENSTLYLKNSSFQARIEKLDVFNMYV